MEAFLFGQWLAVVACGLVFGRPGVLGAAVGGIVYYLITYI